MVALHPGSDVGLVVERLGDSAVQLQLSVVVEEEPRHSALVLQAAIGRAADFNCRDLRNAFLTTLVKSP